MKGEDKATHMKWAVLILLCLQNCLSSVVTRYSKSILKEVYVDYEVVMLAELIKLVVATMFMFTDKSTDTDSQGQGLRKFLWIIWNGKKMIVLTLSYAFCNVCILFALNRVDATVYLVLTQLKLFTTAAFSVAFLGTFVSAGRWRALMLLAIACILVTSPSFNYSSCGEDAASTSEAAIKQRSGSDMLLGVGATLAMVTMSGASAVYLEKVLKRDETKLTIWERNVQLAFYSVLVCMTLSFSSYANSTTAPFEGWSVVTLFIAILQAAGGLLVAATLKYADSIVKNFAVAGSIMLSSILGYIFLNGVLDLFVVLGCLCTIIALFNYTFDMTPAPPPPPQTETDNNSKSTV